MWQVWTGGDWPRVLPIDDLRAHQLSEKCWCRPIFIDGIEVHNALDERDKFERGERKTS